MMNKQAKRMVYTGTMKDKTEELRPDLRPKVKAILSDLKGHGWQPVITEALRTQAKQRENVKKGVSKTMNSKHLADKDGYARAVDIIDQRYGWKPPVIFWLHLASTATAHGMRSGSFFGLSKKQEVLLKEALADGRWDDAQRLKIGWDSAHVEAVD